MENEVAIRIPGPIAERNSCARLHAALRQSQAAPPVARNARGSEIDGNAARHKNCALSLKYRKQIEEAFGLAKRIGGMARTLYCGLDQTDARFTFTMAGNNPARLPWLLAA